MTSARKIDLSPTLFAHEDADAPSPLAAYAARASERAKPPPRTKRGEGKKTIGAAVFTRAKAEVEAMISTGDWSDAGVRHLVAAYALMHERVYGVEAADLTPSGTYQATLFAGTMVKKHFEGKLVEAAEFMRWVWEREAEREEWRRKNGRSGGRIGPKLMFAHGSLVADYKVEKARRG